MPVNGTVTVTGYHWLVVCYSHIGCYASLALRSNECHNMLGEENMKMNGAIGCHDEESSIMAASDVVGIVVAPYHGEIPVPRSI